MAVITISREYGSGGDEIAQIICSATGYQMFDKSLIEQAAAESNISEIGAIAISENEPRAAGFIDRLLRRPSPAGEVRVWREGVDGARTMDAMQLDEDQLRDLVQEAVETAYRRGNFVIVGRGGQAILRDLPGVLHVRVTATIDERILRVRNSPEFIEGQANRSGALASQYDIRLAAQHMIEIHDSASQDYLRRNYGVNWSDSSLYDVSINTTRLNLGTAARMIIEAARLIDSVS